MTKLTKVEKYWGNFHDVIDAKTRRCRASLWTLAQAQKEKEYFAQYVGLDLNRLDFTNQKFHAKQSPDGVWDIIANVKKFNEDIFNQICERVLV